MAPNHPITRRESIKKLIQLSGSLAFSGVMPWPDYGHLPAWAGSKTKGFVVEGIGREQDYSGHFTRYWGKIYFDVVVRIKTYDPAK